MDTKISILFVSLAAVLNINLAVTCGNRKQKLTYATLPDYDSLLTLREFEFFIVDKTMGEMYFAITRPPPFTPDVNYKSNITRISGSFKYLQSTIGESPGGNSICVLSDVHLTPMRGLDKSFFFRGNETTNVQAIWSSCPTKYIWSMRCANFVLGKRNCLLNEVAFGYDMGRYEGLEGIYIHDDMTDAPMLEIMEDLCRVTGVKFGQENFKWFFSFGKNTLC